MATPSYWGGKTAIGMSAGAAAVMIGAALVFPTIASRPVSVHNAPVITAVEPPERFAAAAIPGGILAAPLSAGLRPASPQQRIEA